MILCALDLWEKGVGLFSRK